MCKFALFCRYHSYMSRNVRKPAMWILTRSGTNQTVQELNMATGLRFFYLEVDVLYYPRSEKKGADQLRGYGGADLLLCFRRCKMLVFSGPV